jgi:hypothetical protein
MTVLEHHRGFELLFDRGHADYVRQWIVEVI